MKRITAILFCVLLACMNAQAQRKVKLKVLEKGTEQPVIAATVVYADNEALQNLQGSVTNVDGLAELKIPSKKTYYYKIGCFHLDYLVDLQTVILEIKRDGSRIGYESLSTGFPKLRITE